MQDLFAVSLAFFFLFASANLHASTINTYWKIDSVSQYNYFEGQYEPPTVPTEFELAISFENIPTSSTDYGSDSITYFGEFGGTKFSSPLTQFIGTDPFGIGIQETGYSFSSVSDYSSTFFEELAFQSNTYSAQGSDFWNYHIELRVRRYTESKGGTGNEDYFFTADSVNTFLDDVGSAPEDFNFIFNESWGLYDGATGKYVDGFSWSSYDKNVSLIEVTQTSITVPEPNSLLLSLFLSIIFISKLQRVNAQ